MKRWARNGSSEAHSERRTGSFTPEARQAAMVKKEPQLSLRRGPIWAKKIGLSMHTSGIDKASVGGLLAITVREAYGRKAREI